MYVTGWLGNQNGNSGLVVFDPGQLTAHPLRKGDVFQTTNLQGPLPPALSEDRGDPHTFPPLGTAIKVLMVWPRFPPSFWSFEALLDLIPEETIHPPLGLLTVAALCPKNWKLKLVNRSFEDLLDRDLLWADLVMVSGMAVQKEDIRETLLRARALGKRTMTGGPYASSEPQVLLQLADHVVVGEPDEVFDGIATDLERGSAKRLYVIKDKPDITKTPVPRFDLLQINKYVSMAVQFSRGCPFQCEFCDIITIYGRKPRAKSPRQLLGELDVLFELGWRDMVFIVDDNFIGNHKRALELAQSLEEWQKSHDFPFLFYTEASIDLAERPELINAMVKANFLLCLHRDRESLRSVPGGSQEIPKSAGQSTRFDPLHPESRPLGDGRLHRRFRLGYG